MRNLLKTALGVVVVTGAAGVLASAAFAATPELSPIPPKHCSPSCEHKTVVLEYWGGSGTWTGETGSWNFGVPSGNTVVFESTPEETTFVSGPLTLTNNLCRNEGLNFKTANLKGHLIAREGRAAAVVEPQEGSLWGKCTQSGTNEEVTGSTVTEAYIGSAGAFHFGLVGEEYKQFEAEEEPHKLTYAHGPLRLTGDVSTYPTTAELHTAGRTATFVTPKYEGGFELLGGVMRFVSKNGETIKCNYSRGEGRLTSATGGEARLTFTGCTGALGKPCTGLNTTELNAQLAYTYPATETAEGRQTGLVLSPKSGSVINEFECGGVKAVTTGAMMAVITPLGKAASTFALTLKQTNGVNEHILYESSEGVQEAMLRNAIEKGKAEQSGMEIASPSIKLNAGGEETIK